MYVSSYCYICVLILLHKVGTCGNELGKEDSGAVDELGELVHLQSSACVSRIRQHTSAGAWENLYACSLSVSIRTFLYQ